MRKSTKIWIVTAASLILVGCVTFCVVMTGLGWDFEKISTTGYKTNIVEVHEEFRNLSINTDTADVILLPSEDGSCRVTLYEQEKQTHTVRVQNGTLTINVLNKNAWYDHIGINFDTPRITVSLPQGAYDELVISSDTGDVEIPKEFHFTSIDISEQTGNVSCQASAATGVKISASTGDIDARDLSASSLALSSTTGDITLTGVTSAGDVRIDVTTGKVRLTDLACGNLISSGDTGNIHLKNVIATGTISIERSTGDVKLNASDASELAIVTDTGDVEGSLLSNKVFAVKTDTGDVRVPESAAGGVCTVTTDTGDIRIDIVPH